MRTVLLALLALLLAASTASAQEPTPLPAAPGSEAEPNQTPDTATPIEAGERIRAQRTVGDVDLYRFNAEEGDRVFAAVMTLASAQTDSRLALLGPDGATVLESDNDNGTLAAGSSSIAGARIPAAGTYYVRVDSPTDAMELLPYDLLLDVQSDDPTPEVEPHTQTPQPLGGVRFVSGTTAADDPDFSSLELGAGDTVFLSLDLDPERDGERFNGRVAFGNETLLVANDIGNSDAIPSEAYVGTVSVDGTYNLLVDAAAGSGTYQLSITVIRAVERGCRTYSPTPGAITDLAATTFPIEVPDAGTIDHVALRLDLTHNFMSDLDATLEAPAGNRTVLFDDIGSTNTGSNTRMLTLFDDNAGTPPAYTWLKGFGLQPDRSALSYFAGQPAAGTWQLTFRDDAREDAGELARADLILCTRPEEGPADDVFSAGFESGDDGFTHSGTADEWEQGTPATAADGHLAGLDDCADGTGCFKTDLDGSYEPNSSQDLVSPPISLAGRTGEIYASWQMWYQLEGVRFEHFTVSVEEDGGANARPLFTWGGNDMVASHGNPVLELGLAAGWGRHRADVSDYAGKTIRLRFHLDSDNTVQRRGVAIDDVRVYQPLAAAAADAYEIDEDVALVGAPGVLDNDVDAETAALESGPQHGQLELDPDGSFTYTPDRDYNGTDSFTYRAVANGLGSEPATVTIQVHPVDDAPTAGADAFATDEDTPLNVDAPGLLANDVDPDGDALTASLETGPAHGSVEVRPDGSLTYTPERDFNGTDSFAYRAGNGPTATVTIEVRAVDDPAPPASPPGDVAPATAADEPAISDLRLGARCVRRSATGRVRVPMTIRLAQPGAIQVRVERAVGSKGRRSCPRANPVRNQRFRGVAEFRPVATAQAASTTRRVNLDLRLRPGLYRLTVRVQLEDGRLSPPVRRFLRVLG